MSTHKGIVVASLIFALAPANASAGSFREWLLSDAPLQMQDPRPMKVAEVRLDASAQRCLACHDGSRATKVTASHGGPGVTWSSAGSSGHPVGMDYQAVATRAPRHYVPRAALDPALRLPGGQVSCTTCHRSARDGIRVVSAGMVQAAWMPSAQHDDRCEASTELTVGPRQVDLCQSCHRL